MLWLVIDVFRLSLQTVCLVYDSSMHALRAVSSRLGVSEIVVIIMIN